MNKKTGYERVKQGEKFYYVDIDGNTIEDFESGLNVDKAVYNTANYYSSSLVAENNARADELMRKLRRFAVEHNECELDWESEDQEKFYIEYDYKDKCFSIDSCVYFKKFGQIYFSSQKIAEQAIEEYEGDLIWYFTEYQDHVVEAETEECEWCGDEKKLQAMLTLGYKTCPYCCEDCPAYNLCNNDIFGMCQTILDLINRQQAEIERYKHSIKLLEDDVATAKSETITKFAERLKDIVFSKYEFTDVRVFSELDNLVKEITEGEKVND